MRRLSVLVLLILFSTTIFAQKSNYTDWHPSQGALLDGKTIIKTNLFGFTSRNYNFQAERIITKRVSVLAAINTMPNGKIPYIDRFTDDPSINDIQISSLAFTPEVRIYIGNSGYGKGFYVAPYYKYEKFNAKNYLVDFEDETNTTRQLDLSGRLNTHSFGAALGIQWLLGKNDNIIIDWTMIGVHYGSNKGDLSGHTNYTISETSQKELKKIITDGLGSIEIGNLEPIEIEEIFVDSNNAKVSISSPWASIRGALSIGFRF